MHPGGRTLPFIPLALAVMACNFATDLADRLIGEMLQLAPEIQSTAVAIPPSLIGTPPLATQQVQEATPGLDPELSIPPEIRDQMDQIQEEVALIRGLQPTGPVGRALISPEELRQYVLDDFLADYTDEEARDDARTLALFGLIDPDFDLFSLYLELYSEQIAGFYDDETKQMFVVQGAGFLGLERITYAHEYVHALQDQQYDLQNGLGFSDEACEEDSERCAAVQSLVEGDATLADEQWLLTYATEQDYQDLLDFYDTFDSPIFDSAPQFLREDFLFPYEFGRAFVDHFFLDGGWAAVDAVYADPPLSTEQILHPEQYPGDRPVRLELPELVDALGSGYRQIDQDVLGEWFTQLTLREHLSPEQAEPAAEGWGGDYYITLFHDQQQLGALVLVTTWDTVVDAHEFYGTFRDYGDQRFGGRTLSTTARSVWEWAQGYASIEILGDQTLWIVAPDAELAAKLRQAVPFPAVRSQ